MRYKIILILSLLATSLTAVAQAVNDTVYEPSVLFNGIPATMNSPASKLPVPKTMKTT